jgi:Holliday junction resolvase
MTGAMSRNKGCRGELEGRRVLLDHDFEIVETSRGLKCEDVYATRNGRHYAVEIKWHERWDLKAWRKQAKENATKRKCSWLLMVRINAWPGWFYIEGTDWEPTTWHGKR